MECRLMSIPVLRSLNLHSFTPATLRLTPLTQVTTCWSRSVCDSRIDFENANAHSLLSKRRFAPIILKEFGNVRQALSEESLTSIECGPINSGFATNSRCRLVWQNKKPSQASERSRFATTRAVVNDSGEGGGWQEGRVAPERDSHAIRALEQPDLA